MAKKVNKKSRRSKKISKKVIDKTIMTIDEVYKSISNCQINKKTQVLTIATLDSPVIENLLRDASVSFTKQNKQDKCVYRIQPPPEVEIDDAFFDFEEMEDEIQDKEQCF